MNRIIPALILFVLLITSMAYCEEAMIANARFVPDNSLMVSFEVKNAFTKKIEEAIKSGIPTSFTFRIEFNRKRRLWFNDGVARLNFKHTVKYDNLKEEYTISLGEKSKGVKKVKDFNQMKSMMASVKDISILPLKDINKDERYEIRIKAQLDAIRLPFPLNYMLYFVPFWNFETDWYVKEYVSK